ncbi:MAG: hypothetical protein ABI599_03450 [Flavobacteriales bacterium]
METEVLTPTGRRTTRRGDDPVQGWDTPLEQAPAKTNRTPLTGYLWSKKYWILLVSVLAAAATAIAFVRDPVLYGSSVVVYLSDAEVNATEHPLFVPEHSPGLNRLGHMSASTEMVDHLISTFALYAHYGIDTLAPLYHERASANLMEKIEVKVLDPNTISITVYDSDRTMAALLVNDLYRELRLMTERGSTAYLEGLSKLYRQVIDHSRAEAEKRMAELVTLADGVNAMRMGSTVDPGDAQLREMDLRLMEVVAELSSSNHEFIEMGKRYEITATALGQQQLPNLTLMRQGMIDLKTRPWEVIFFSIVGVMLLCALLCIGTLIIWFKHGHEFTDYFAGHSGSAAVS